MTNTTGSGGSGSGAYWIVSNHPSGGYWVTGASTPSGATQGTNSANVGAGAVNSATVNSTYSERAIEEAGIRAGEIIGYRAWWLDKEGFLHSMYVQDFRWEPGKTYRACCYGWIRANSDYDRLPLQYNGVGYHAYKSLEEVKETYTLAPGGPVVYGQVAMWGDVMECERGYRAEYAKVHKIIGFAYPRLLAPWRFVTLIKLRRRYGV
jgi:hypothetical protein